MYGSLEMVTKINEVCAELTEYYGEEPKSSFVTQFEKSGYREKPVHKNILMGLMQTINEMAYPPFFYLCDRIEDSNK